MADFEYDEVVVMDDDLKLDDGDVNTNRGSIALERSPLAKTRSLSDGGGTQLSPSPHIVEAARRTSKDDSNLRDVSAMTAPVTPRRHDFPLRGLSLQMPPRDAAISPAQTTPISIKKPPPLSPKLDHSQIYASPTNILPRRSRGLDFSRAATSLHHSTLADQSSPDSSPTIGGRAMNIPARRGVDYGAEQSSNSLWSIMGNQERMNISSSVGSNANALGSDSSLSSDEDDFMDEDMEDAILSTPQAPKSSSRRNSQTPGSSVPWMPGPSPAVSSLANFRSRPRKQHKKKFRNLLGLGFNPSGPAGLSKSPPNNMMKEIKDVPMAHSRRESISWAANQLHISGSENEERAAETAEAILGTPGKDGQRGVIRRVVTRRGNLLPKTKGFARIRAALLEEGAPVDTEVRREAEVVRQVRESDMDLEPRIPAGPPPPLDLSTLQPSPSLGVVQDSLIDVPEDDLNIGDPRLSSSFKQQALRNSKGKNFWETFSETSSVTGPRITPPPPAFLPRGSSSGISEDINMDSPSLSAGSGNTSLFGQSGAATGGTPGENQQPETPHAILSAPSSQTGTMIPTAAEITRRINNKRRRDDDYFDPTNFKRRAVSPGMSVHNSPVMQSPLQRDIPQWSSRPSSNHGAEKASATPSDNGSSGGGTGASTTGPRPINAAKRVGFQGMVDTNDGLMRMSIE